MKSSPNRELASSKSLWIGPVIGVLFLLACMAWIGSDVLYSNRQDEVIAGLLGGGSLGSRLSLQIAGYGLALLALHCAFGILVFTAARFLATSLPLLNKAPRQFTWLIVLVFAALVLGANSALYPASKFAVAGSLLADSYAGLPLAAWLAMPPALALSVGLIGSGVVLARRRPFSAFGLATVIVLLMIDWTGLVPAGQAEPFSPATTSYPNIIIIGVDSLRNDRVGVPDAASPAPHIDSFVAASTRFEDTTTPLARTFGSWVSILSGRHPVDTGARINLMPRNLVHEGETLPLALKKRGYVSVYATDEVRFANIDQSYGFDQVITPPIGAADFLLGSLNDLPLPNLLASTEIGRLLFPNTYANRAAYVTYRPEDFTRRLDREIPKAGRPVFLSVHLTLTHWPYSWAGKPKTPSQPIPLRTAYQDALAAVDRQFADVVSILRSRGLLQNAVVIVLSDHGEGLGFADDNMLRTIEPIGQTWGSMWGHGTSVMGTQQYQVLMAFRGFGPSASWARPADISLPASVEDIAPTILDLLDIKPDEGFSGLSLARILENPAARPGAIVDRIRFTETDFNTPSVLAGKFDEKNILKEAGRYYELVPATGWVQFRPGNLDLLLARKQRAAMLHSLHLAAVPVGDQGIRYYLTDLATGVPQVLTGPPDPLRQPDAARLWEALHARFPGELPDAMDAAQM